MNKKIKCGIRFGKDEKILFINLIPRLLEIDDELNSLGIQSAKSILFSPEKRDFYVE